MVPYLGQKALKLKAEVLLVAGLTTTECPWIEEAQLRGQLFIDQPYHLYSEENHETWRRLYQRIRPLWERYANEAFLRGVDALGLHAGRIPKLEEVNCLLEPLTGFRLRAVSGYIPAYIFFDCLRRREFPITITIRRIDRLDYLPEPDIFHDLAGHVPMHTDPAFAETLVRFGQCAQQAAQLVSTIGDSEDRNARLRSMIQAMARFFWFTIEFGLMRDSSGVKAYGSGLLSSFGELRHAIESSRVQRFPLQLEWVINQSFEIHHFQPLLFVVDSFEHLYSLVEQFAHWMREGRLDNVAPGEPQITDRDLESFLKAELGQRELVA